MVTERLEEFDHPTWVTVGSTLVSYGLVLLGMTVLLFGIPFAVFYLLA